MHAPMFIAIPNLHGCPVGNLPPLVTLTPFEIEVAQLLAIRRIISSSNKHLRSKAMMGDQRPYDTEYVGAACEIAFAKYFGTYPGLTVDTFKEPDVGGMQV